MINLTKNNYHWQILVLGLITMSGFVAYLPTASAAEITDYEKVAVPAPHLGNGLFENNFTQDVFVFLPWNYEENTRGGYPVIYFTQGLEEDLDAILSALKYKFYSQEFEDAIVVLTTSLFLDNMVFSYQDSDIAGNWAQFLTQDLIPFIDEEYRTLPESTARGITTQNFWLGAQYSQFFGALQAKNCFLYDEGSDEHPLHRNSAYIEYFLDNQENLQEMIAGETDEETIKQIFVTEMNRLSTSTIMTELLLSFMYATGMAISPNASRSGCYLNFPYERNGSSYVEIPAILEIYDAGIGGIDAKVNMYASGLQQLAIDIIYYGLAIVPGIEYAIYGNVKLGQSLSNVGISYSSASHSLAPASTVMIQDLVIPFFIENLDDAIISSGFLGSIPGYPLGSLVFFCGLVIFFKIRKNCQ